MSERKKMKVTFMAEEHLIVEMPSPEAAATWAKKVVERKRAHGDTWVLHSIEEAPNKES